MACDDKAAQKYGADIPHSQSQGQVEPEIHDLDDPYLIPKLLDKCASWAVAAGTITSRFRAIPLNDPDSFSRDITQYGQVLLENRDKLIMRVPRRNIDLLDRIRQVWVSKYLTPFTECTITFDLPRRNPNPTTMVIIQRSLHKMDKDKYSSESPKSDATDDTVTTGGDSPTTNNGQAPSPELLGDEGEGDSVHRRSRRRRATSLPSPDVMAELGQNPWHVPQLLCDGILQPATIPTRR